MSLSQVSAIDALIPPEAAPELGKRVPSVGFPAAVTNATIPLYGACNYSPELTAALIGGLADLVKAAGSPDRLALAIQFWALEAKRLSQMGGSSQINVAHNVARGKTAGLEVTTTQKF